MTKGSQVKLTNGKTKYLEFIQCYRVLMSNGLCEWIKKLEIMITQTLFIDKTKKHIENYLF